VLATHDGGANQVEIMKMTIMQQATRDEGGYEEEEY
jgi:hypothetical protein